MIFRSSKVLHSLTHALLLMFFITACNENNKTKDGPASPVDDTQKIPAAHQEINTTAGDPSFVVVGDTVSSYGPVSITRSVLQDKEGNIWFASWEGIVRYDGKSFTNMTLREGLRRFHIFSLLEDRTGNIWFGTVGGGVYRYDSRLKDQGQGRAFTLFTTEDGLADDKVFSMLEDVGGNIWFGSGGGLSRFDGNTFTNFKKEEGLNDNFVCAIARDRSGTLWFGNNGGVNKFDANAFPSGLTPGKKYFTDFKISKDTSFHNVRSIIVDRAGNTWIGAAEGLYKYDPASRKLTRLATHFATQIFEDKGGNIWLAGSEEGGKGMILSKYDGHSFIKIKESLQVFGITDDKAGNIWFGTASGAECYNPVTGVFTDFKKK